jgi:hypothetical protein
MYRSSSSTILLQHTYFELYDIRPAITYLAILPADIPAVLVCRLLSSLRTIEHLVIRWFSSYSSECAYSIFRLRKLHTLSIVDERDRNVDAFNIKDMECIATSKSIVTLTLVRIFGYSTHFARVSRYFDIQKLQALRNLSSLRSLTLDGPISTEQAFIDTLASITQLTSLSFTLAALLL